MCNKEDIIEKAIANVEKQFGVGAIMPLGEHADAKGVEVIPTGALSVDIATSVGGVPCGRVVEIFGPESSGKSTLSTHIMASCQKLGGVSAYIDAEHSFDSNYAQEIGVNPNELLLAQPSSGEEALNIVEELSDSGVNLIVIDSVAALVPKNELDGSIGDLHVGAHARIMSQALRKLSGTFSKNNTCGIFINQIREKVGVSFGNPEVTTGGRALKFYSSLRIDVRRIGSIRNQENMEVGIRVRAKIVKNKMAPPFRCGEFEIMFSEGISRAGCVIDLGISNGLIEKKGVWLSYDGIKVQGREALKEVLKKDEPLLNKLELEAKNLHHKTAVKAVFSR